jgi:hypothetical protein
MLKTCRVRCTIPVSHTSEEATMSVTRTRKLGLVAAAFVALGLSATSASAETFWQAHHPRRAEVNARLDYQNFRINREVREGELSPWQARRLHREDFAIRHEERTMASFNHGHITSGERRALNHQENVMSRRIGY